MKKHFRSHPPVGHLSRSHWQWHANDHDQRVHETSSTLQPASTSWHRGYTWLALLRGTAFILPSMSKLSSYWSPTAKFSLPAGGMPCGSIVKNSPWNWCVCVLLLLALSVQHHVFDNYASCWVFCSVLICTAVQMVFWCINIPHFIFHSPVSELHAYFSCISIGNK